jgi:pyruvate-formate lyase
VSINSKGASRRDSFFPQTTKAIEFLIYNGRDPEPGYEWVKSIETGDPTKFKDFEEFYEAWLKQWEWIVKTEIRLRNRCYARIKEDYRRPFVSALYKGCLETGKDIMLTEMAGLSFRNVVGWVDSIDSLAAVKYCVFDQKKYTMAQLVEALKADWEG